MTYDQRMRAAHTIACFMTGDSISPIQQIQRFTIVVNTPISNMLERIYKKQRGLTEQSVTYDTVARN